MKYIKNNIEYILYFISVAIILWVLTSTTIQRFKCPQLTETELLLLIPNSSKCNWQNCN